MLCQLIKSISDDFLREKILRYQPSWVHKQSTQLKQITVNRHITTCEMKDSSNSVSKFSADQADCKINLCLKRAEPSCDRRTIVIAQVYTDISNERIEIDHTVTARGIL